MHKHARSALIVSALLILLVPPIAIGQARASRWRAGRATRRFNASLAYTRETEIIADNTTCGTRQSNKSNSGGGAIYGCRSLPGGTPTNHERGRRDTCQQ